MRWTERQRAMLREIGIPPFWPAEESAPPDLPAQPALEAVQAVRGGAAPVASVAPVAPVAIGQAVSQVASALAASQGRSLPGTATPPSAGPASNPRGASPARQASAPPGAASRPAPAVDVTLGARPAGIESMGWPALREAVAGCQACGLCQSRKNPVFGVGNEQAQWMIVGEAPGEQEDRQGEPFVGKAGQLLDRMLAALDLTRAEAPSAQQVFIANVLKCRPPANRNPQPQEVAQCEPFLLRQIALVQPKVILAMGRFAVQSLLKSTEPIGRLRGRVHEVAGVPVVVTYHPAYLLRSPGDKALAWDDLCLARERMGGPQA